MALKHKQLTAQLAEVAEHYDTRCCWPQRSIDIIADAGCWKWTIPKRWGGAGLNGAELLEGYEAVARGCAATALILTQRDGAVDLIAGGENDGLKKRLLRAYAKAERFTSIGIAQLTTSKGGRKPALTAKRAGRGYVLDGVVPWVTAAEQCDEIVVGAVLPDGRQLITTVSCEDLGVTIEAPMDLLALGASMTSRVRCQSVRVKPDDVVRGPAKLVLSMRAPVKPLVVSAVGIGLAGALHDRLTRSRVAPELMECLKPLKATYKRVRSDFYDAAGKIGKRGSDVDAAAIRVRINELVTKMGMAHLTISKGSGYCRPHSAERLLREAMLFLVWSAPVDIQVRTLHTLLGNGATTPTAATSPRRTRKPSPKR